MRGRSLDPPRGKRLRLAKNVSVVWSRIPAWGIGATRVQSAGDREFKSHRPHQIPPLRPLAHRLLLRTITIRRSRRAPVGRVRADTVQRPARRKIQSEQTFGYIARTSDNLGFHSRVTDRPFHGFLPRFEPLMLPFFAAQTRSVKSGTSISLFPPGDPILLAKTISTLDHISEGRTIVELGLGRHDSERGRSATSFEGRAHSFAEGVTLRA